MDFARELSEATAEGTIRKEITLALLHQANG